MSTDNVPPIYAAHLYPAAAIGALLEAREMMVVAWNLLDLLLEEGNIAEGDPATAARDLLDQALNMLEPDDEGNEAASAEAAKPQRLTLVVDNTREN